MAAPPLLLGLDVSTTGSKALLIDPAGGVTASATHPPVVLGTGLEHAGRDHDALPRGELGGAPLEDIHLEVPLHHQEELVGLGMGVLGVVLADVVVSAVIAVPRISSCAAVPMPAATDSVRTPTAVWTTRRGTAIVHIRNPCNRKTLKYEYHHQRLPPVGADRRREGPVAPEEARHQVDHHPREEGAEGGLEAGEILVAENAFLVKAEIGKGEAEH